MVVVVAVVLVCMLVVHVGKVDMGDSCCMHVLKMDRSGFGSPHLWE